VIMGHADHLFCLNCGATFPLRPLLDGCGQCAKPNFRANLSVGYDLKAIRRRFRLSRLRSQPWNMWRYRELLPIAQEQNIVSLWEGGTPLLDWTSLGKGWGLAAPLYAKDESRNPTWSFKDRLGAVAVSMAREFGFSVITDSSTGNQGAASAAHAAKARLPAVIFTNRNAPAAMKMLMRSFGASVVALENPADRRSLLEECVRELGWYPMCNFVFPPVGSNVYGIEGYKTIAFEIWEQLPKQVPDVIAFPTDYGDGIQGIWKGFRELRALRLVDKVPRLLAVERFGPLENALRKNLQEFEEVPTEPTIALSIATSISTYQALKVLKESKGNAVSVDDEEIKSTQSELGRLQGAFLEASSAAGFAGIRKAVARGIIRPEESVVGIITSSGLKDPAYPQDSRYEVPIIEASLPALARTLKEEYGVDILC
jgi:threonine synthase